MLGRRWRAIPLAVIALVTVGCAASSCGFTDWSPDGRKIVTIWPSDGSHNVLRVVDIQTGHSRTIPGSSDATSPRWSPDGRWIAFARAAGDSVRANVHDLKTGETKRLGDRPCVPLVWREDSARLLAVAEGGVVCFAMPGGELTWEAPLPEQANTVASGLWIKDTDNVALLVDSDLWLIEGAEATRLTHTKDVIGFALRSSGKELIWARGIGNPGNGSFSLYIMPLKERSAQRLPLPQRIAEINTLPRPAIKALYQVAFAPDGNRLALHCVVGPARQSRDPDTERVYTMDADGKNVRLIFSRVCAVKERRRSAGAPSPAIQSLISFSPDGKRLSFLWGDSRHGGLYVCSADGSGCRAIGPAH
jgi:WD40 repeat protein